MLTPHSIPGLWFSDHCICLLCLRVCVSQRLSAIKVQLELELGTFRQLRCQMWYKLYLHLMVDTPYIVILQCWWGSFHYNMFYKIGSQTENGIFANQKQIKFFSKYLQKYLLSKILPHNKATAHLSFELFIVQIYNILHKLFGLKVKNSPKSAP